MPSCKDNKFIVVESVEHHRHVESALVDFICELLHLDFDFLGASLVAAVRANEVDELVADVPWLLLPWQSAVALGLCGEHVEEVEPEDEVVFR